MTKTVRETKRVDELKLGDWLAAGNLPNDGDRPAEVLGVHLFTEKDGPGALLVYRTADGRADAIGSYPDIKYDLATQEELNAGRKAADRARFATGLREFADWIEANPSVPIGWDGCGFQEARVQVDLHGANEDATAATIARVREIADRLGVKVQELDDRTDASVHIGAVSYSVIAWHRDGRPAESEPEAGR